MAVGAYFAITARHGRTGDLSVRERLQAEPAHLVHGPSAVLWAVADVVVDSYLDAAEEIEDDIADLETLVFTETAANHAERIHRVTRALVELRRIVAPLAPRLRSTHEKPHAAVATKVRPQLRTVAHHLDLVHDQLSTFDEVVNSILQANLAQLSVRQNEDMRKITSWAAIIAVPTAIAGIYGMNFRHMPELHWVWGYPASLVVMAAVCVVLYVNFKRRGWL